CGACTVVVDGMLARSCLVFAPQVEGAQVRTIEGVSSDEALHPLAAAFQKHHALQCGFCTPGIIMSTLNFLETTPAPTEREVRYMLSGHICRCTGYEGMVRA